MKFLMLALIAAGSIASVSMAEAKTVYVTEKVCTGGESGTECQMVTYKVRPETGKVTVASCQSAELEVIQLAHQQLTAFQLGSKRSATGSAKADQLFNQKLLNQFFTEGNC